MDPDNYRLSPELAAEVMTVVYTRRDAGFDVRNKPLGRIFGWPESRVRRAKKIYAWGFTNVINISKIRRDGGTQARSEIPSEVRATYLELMRSGHRFPPPVVYYDGSNYWCADGHIRLDCADELGLTEIEAEIRQGALRDAILYSFSANTRHGCPPTTADRRRAAIRMLQDTEWSRWSDRQIARQCGIGSPSTIAAYRNESHCPNWTDATNQTRLYIRNGSVVPYLAPSVSMEPTVSVSLAVMEPYAEPDEPETIDETTDAESDVVAEWVEESEEEEHETATNEAPDESDDELVATQTFAMPMNTAPEIERQEDTDEPIVVLTAEPSHEPGSIALDVPIAKARTINENDRSDSLVRGCRVYGELTDECLAKFKAEVRFYRTIHRTLQKFQERVVVARNQYHDGDAADAVAGPYVTRALILATAPEPRDWAPCMNCRDTALMSSGRVRGRKCGACRGFGFTVALPTKESLH